MTDFDPYRIEALRPTPAPLSLILVQLPSGRLAFVPAESVPLSARIPVLPL